MAREKPWNVAVANRETGLSYKSALFLMHRVRFGMSDPIGYDDTQLEGIVEVDETFVGGKPDPQNRRAGVWSKRKKRPVLAMVERGGRVRAFPVSRITPKTLQGAVRRQ